MNSAKFQTIKKFLFRKRILVPLGLIVIITVFQIARGDGSTFAVITPTEGTLKETVRATGQVISNTDLELSFGTDGEVKEVLVSVGDKVTKDTILAKIDGRIEKASLLSAQAKLKRTGEDVVRAEVDLVTARREYEATKLLQDTLVTNAYHTLLNSTPEAYTTETDQYAVVPTITGTYKLGKEGVITIEGYYSYGGTSFRATGITTGEGMMSSTIPQPVGDSGLYIKFPNTNAAASTWTISIPNTKASDYLANLGAYTNALKTRIQSLAKAQASVDDATINLRLKKDPSFSADTDSANADILSAQAKYDDTILRAPSDGTITEVNIKYGETARTNEKAMVLQDLDNLYIEALINESNITSVALEQSVLVTIDALGTTKTFSGKVTHIDPASLSTDGVINYKIKVSLNEKSSLIRPGMNAEITITSNTKENVLSIPGASITKRDGKSFVNVITNEKRRKSEEREIKTGTTGDGNLVEVLSGLSKIDHITLPVKK